MNGGMSDAELTEVLGEKCPECGWRRGDHRPQIGGTAACSQRSEA